MVESADSVEPHGKEWRLEKLGDITQIIGGTTPSTSQPTYWDGEITWITPADLGKKSGVTIDNSERKISQKGLDSCALQILPAHTVIMSCRAPIGHLAIVTVDFCTNQGCKALLASKKIVPGYLYYILLQSVPKIKALGAGATFAEISKSELEKFEILLPSVGTQTRIATILTNLDQLITTTEALLAKQQRLRTGLLHDLLTRGLDQHGQLRSEETHEFKDSPLGRIPVDWEVVSLGEKFTIKSGSTPLRSQQERYFSNGNIPWVKTLDLNETAIYSTQENITDIGLAESSCQIYPVDTVLIAMYGGWEQIGRTAILKIQSATNQAISALIPRDDIEMEYVLICLQQSRILWKKVAVSTRKDPNITKNDVESFQIKMPNSMDEQRAIVHLARVSKEHSNNQKQRLTKLRRLKTGLMQDLLTGRVPVGDLDSLLPEA
jgi:type I restriction enzyme S subunit